MKSPPIDRQPSGTAWPGTAGEDESLGPSLMASLWRHKFLLIATAILAGAVGYGLSLLQPTLYESSGRLFLSDPTEAAVFSDGARFDMALHTGTEVERLTSRPVLERAGDLLGVQTPSGQLGDRLSVSSSADLGLITVTATASDPQGAAELTNAVAVAYQQIVTEQGAVGAQQAGERLAQTEAELQEQLETIRAGLEVNPDDLVLQAQLDATTGQLSEVRARAEELAVDAALEGSGVELYEPAQVPDEPSQPEPARNAALTAVVGLAAAGAVAYWNAGRHQKALHRDDPAAVLGAPLLGAVPEHRLVSRGPSGTWILGNVGPAAAEAYQFIVASVEFALEESGGTTVLVTSAAPAEGKTVTTLNMAMAANRGERNLILIDGDTRARALSRIARAASHRGLSELAQGDQALDDYAVRLSTRLMPSAEERIMPFVPAGRPLQDASGFFRTTAFRKTLIRIKEVADVVLIDSPPILAVADTVAMAAQVDAVVLVVNRGTPIEHLVEARRRLELIGAPLIGYVFNRDASRSQAGGYAYGYGYGDRGKPPRKRGFKRFVGRPRQHKHGNGSGAAKTDVVAGAASGATADRRSQRV